jgi:DNA-3-methyladenine glycosylase II
MLIGTLTPTPPYDFEKSITAARLHTVLDVIRPGEYWRALALDGQTVLLRVTSRGSMDMPCLDVHLMAATGPVDGGQVLAQAGHLLGVQGDLRPFYAVARADTRLWRIVEPLFGVRHVRAASVFEALITTIIEQQIALSMAQRAERWLVQWAGNGIVYAGETFYTFPTPTQLARASVEDLKPLKITNRRMAVLIDVAQHISTLHFDENPQMLYQALMSVRGIGHWTAAWTIIRALGVYAYVGENDVALQAAVNHFFYDVHPVKKATPQVVRETLGLYGAFAGTAAFFTLLHWGMMKY